jgi:probable addiction module antidote protein
MNRTVDHHDFLMGFLANPKKAAAYLNSAAEEGDFQYLLKALRNVVEAQGGFTQLARKARMSRTSLYKALSEQGNPEVSTLEAILKVYGIRIGFFPEKHEYCHAA